MSFELPKKLCANSIKQVHAWILDWDIVINVQPLRTTKPIFINNYSYDCDYDTDEYADYQEEFVKDVR